MNQDTEKKFLEAYSQHSDAIFRLVFFKLNNRDRALDLTQETFMKTWLHMTTNSVDNIKAFLYKVAGNLIIDEYRKRDKRDYMTSSLEDLSDAGFEPHIDEDELETITNKLDGEKLLGLISELPDTYSNIMFMRYSEELTITEISETIGETPNVVSVRLNRGLKKLRELVDAESNKK